MKLDKRANTGDLMRSGVLLVVLLFATLLIAGCGGGGGNSGTGTAGVGGNEPRSDNGNSSTGNDEGTVSTGGGGTGSKTKKPEPPVEPGESEPDNTPPADSLLTIFLPGTGALSSPLRSSMPGKASAGAGASHAAADAVSLVDSSGRSSTLNVVDGVASVMVAEDTYGIRIQGPDIYVPVSVARRQIVYSVISLHNEQLDVHKFFVDKDDPDRVYSVLTLNHPNNLHREPDDAELTVFSGGNAIVRIKELLLAAGVDNPDIADDFPDEYEKGAPFFLITLQIDYQNDEMPEGSKVTGVTAINKRNGIEATITQQGSDIWNIFLIDSFADSPVNESIRENDAILISMESAADVVTETVVVDHRDIREMKRHQQVEIALPAQ